MKKLITFLSIILVPLLMQSQIVPVGSGSYRTTFPGVDGAGRNAFPSGTLFVSVIAVGKHIPTRDWWSALVKNGTASNLFNYPFTMKTKTTGLVVTYIPFGVIDDIEPVTIGVTGMAATKTTVSDHSDWTVTMDWNDGTHQFNAISGVGMPFLYFIKQSTDVAQVTVTSGNVTVSNEMLIITNLRNNADFAVYAPTGSTWTQNGGVYTSTLNGQNYWSLAFIPLTAANVTSVANEYKKYAYVFPVKTTATYSYNESTSVMRTDFKVQTEVKEGTDTSMLIGLLPHQWAHLTADSPVPDKYIYKIIRGEMKTMAGNSFSVENKFHGILPTLPYVDNYSSGFSPASLHEKITSLENNSLATWTDSYNEGQVMNQLIQTARIADEMGNTEALNKIKTTIKTRLENWLKAENGEVAFLFYYFSTWSTMIGYPGGYGQDGNLNDHHFHWAYFIHAAAFMEQYEPGWAANWGEMVNLLVRDAASSDRNDTKFPYLRNFSPYEGHSWADGFANNPQGNNQESSSESMLFASSLIHWGEVIGDKNIRDLGIYLYTTEQTGIEEYFLDTKDRNFPASQQYSLVSRVWSNSFDNGTFWTGDIAASYGIEIYPIHGGSLYLGLDTIYAKKLWEEVKNNTGIMSNQANPNLWHDMWWEYLAFIDPPKAIEMYNSYPDREIKFGVSDAQTYHWIHAMNALGKLDASITADYPIAAAFTLNGKYNYVAHNYTNAPITVTFSDGYQLQVPAKKMVTNRDCQITGSISSSFSQAFVGGSVDLDVTIDSGTPTKVEFMDGTVSLGTILTEPFSFKATNLNMGNHGFYAKIYDGEKLSVTNSVLVQVGEQVPYNGSAWVIPGIIESGKFDKYEGGSGQNIAYLDLSKANAGDFRKDESVDASTDATEGSIVGYIDGGEWLEYTVNVSQSGLYSFAFRYASGNKNGGGPFHLELDGQSISSNITVPSTSTTVWTVWATKTVTSIPLTAGEHILKVSFSAGEFNIGKLTFTRTGDLSFSVPAANAGGNQKVILPSTIAILDGSASTESASKTLTYNWTQNFGPTKADFTDATVSNPSVSGLAEGMYSFKLTVTNTDLRTDDDEVLILVTTLTNAAPNVSISSPENNGSFTEGKPVTLNANASDFDGTIQKVEFYYGSTYIATALTAPYTVQWSPPIGNHDLTAKATDNEGAESTSQIVKVEIAPLMRCSETLTTASQGSFTTGYTVTYETVGTNVTITFELLDSKSGLVAYLWKESPFSESQMTNVGGKKFSATISGQTKGSTISYACKFAYSGGMSVTKYISYQVGKNCATVGINNVSAEKIVIYPNPVENNLNLELPFNYGIVTLTDITGKQLQKLKVIDQSMKLDMASYKPGIYFIEVNRTNFKIIKK
jgi:endo-1,3(4)-beta-glucanase